MPSDGSASKEAPSLFSRFIRRAQQVTEPEPPQAQPVEQATERPASAKVSKTSDVSAKLSDSGGNGSGIGVNSASAASAGATSAGASGIQSSGTGGRTGAYPPPSPQAAVATTGAATKSSGDGCRGAAVEESIGAQQPEITKTTTATATTRKVTMDTSDLASSDEYWRMSEEATGKAREQARLVEQATITTVETRNKLTQAEHSKREARRQLTAVQGRFSGVDVEGLRKTYDAAVKDYNRHQAEFVALSDDFNRRKANADRLKATVQEKGAALHQEIAARDATLARAAELRADTERRQGALLEAEELQRRYTSDLAALKLGQDQIEAAVLKAEKELKVSVEEDQVLQAKALAIEEALAKQHNHHVELSALLAEEEAASTNQGKEWEAHKAELAPLSSHHAGLLAAYEADRAKLSELEAEAQAVLDEATALMADADRRALALAEAQADVDSKEESFHGHHNALMEAEAAAEGLVAAAKEQALAANASEARVQQLLVQLQESEDRVDAAQALREDYWKQAKYHGEEGDKISDRHFVRLSEGFPGGGGVMPRRQHTERTERMAGEGLQCEGSETRITSTDKESGSSEKWGNEFEGKRSLMP